MFLFTKQPKQLKAQVIMKITLTSRFVILTAVASFAMAAQSLTAQVQIIDFDVTGSSGGGSLGDDSNYSLTTAWSTTPPASYTVTDLPFYGGYYSDAGDPARWQTNISAEVRLGDNVNTSSEAALVWNKSDFQNGGDANSVTIDGTSSFSINAGYEGLDTDPTLRWALVNDGTTYLSEELSTSFPDGSFSPFTSSNLTSLDWFVFTPSADASSAGTLGTIAGSGTAPNFVDIDGVGFYSDATTDPGENRPLSVQGFTVNATVIPEPSAALLMLSACGAFLLTRRRR